MKTKPTPSQLSMFYIEKDMSIEEVASMFDCGTSTISRLIFKYGLRKPKNTVYERIQRNREKTFMKKYGAKHYMQSIKGYLKYQHKIQKRYGIKCILHKPDIIEKSRLAHLSRYGVEFSIQNPDSNRKRLITLNNKYGDYRKHLSKQCSLHYSRNNSQRIILKTQLGIFKVRSKLEFKIIKSLSTMVDSIKYEPFVIHGDEVTSIPDILINEKILIEIKYYKYSVNNYNLNNLDTRAQEILKAAKQKIPSMRKWANENNYDFYVMTERDLHFNNVNQLIGNLKIAPQNNPILGHY